MQNQDPSKSDLKLSAVNEDAKVNQMPSKSSEVSLPQHDEENLMSSIKTTSAEKSNTPADIVEGVSTDRSLEPSVNKSTNTSNGPALTQNQTVFGRTSVSTFFF